MHSGTNTVVGGVRVPAPARQGPSSKSGVTASGPAAATIMSLRPAPGRVRGYLPLCCGTRYLAAEWTPDLTARPEVSSTPGRPISRSSTALVSAATVPTAAIAAATMSPASVSSAAAGPKRTMPAAGVKRVVAVVPVPVRPPEGVPVRPRAPLVGRECSRLCLSDGTTAKSERAQTRCDCNGSRSNCRLPFHGSAIPAVSDRQTVARQKQLPMRP
jgi:hypothetical protein